MFQYLVLMKDGDFEIVRCQRTDIFLIARLRNAGICAVFPDYLFAEAFVKRLRKEQERLQSGSDKT